MRLASAVSDGLGPLGCLAALCGAAALRSGLLAGVGWGLLAMFFAGILPYLLTWRIRHPAAATAPTKRVRSLYMALAVVTAAVGIAVLRLLGGPPGVIEVIAAILGCLTVAAVTNARWRWSNHLAACAAGTAMLTVLFGPPGLVSALAIPPVWWARTALGRHTTVELLGGGLVGGLIGGGLLALLT